MSTNVKPVPDGFSSVTPYLVVDGAAKMIDFLRDAFGAKELRRMAMPGGKIGHAEVRIGESMVMLADANPQFGAQQAGIHLYLPGVDEVYQRALRAGATTLREPADQFYGDRSAVVRDAWGNWWSISTHVEDVSDEEMARRAQEMQKKMAEKGSC
jgi:PhnB protein